MNMSSVIVRRLKKRLSKARDKNALVIILGDTGDGKSYSALGLCKAVDPTFNAGRVAHMTANNFMRILNDSELKRGMAIVWDDVGKGLKKRDWYEMINKIVIDVLQTFRVMGLLVVFTVPDKRLVDSLLLALFHFWGETVTIEYKEELNVLKFFQVQINRRSGKAYFKYPRTKERGRVKVIKRLKIKKPPADLIRQYKKDKNAAVSKLITKSWKEIAKIEETEKKKLVTDEEVKDAVIHDIQDYTNKRANKVYIDPYLIVNNFKISWYRANKIKRVVERKLGMK